MPIQSVNPATGQIEKTFEVLSTTDLEAKITAAETAARHVRRSPVSDRRDWLMAAADLLRAEAEPLSALVAQEMGKTRAAARAEITKCDWLFEYYAEHGPGFLAEEPVTTQAAYSAVRYRPLGPVLAVMPWNYPLWQVFRFAVPALLSGNVVLLKHASNVPQCALAIEDIWRRAGVPDNAFQTLLIGSDQVAGLLSDPRIRAVTLTGSEPAGRAVAETAGRHLKKVVLELGGSDPFIVMPSADLDAAVTHAVRSRTRNNGQSCIAAKRFIIHADVYDRFRDKFANALSQLKVGDPMDAATDIGPLATESVRDDLINQIEASIAAGATRTLGAERLNRPGWFVSPGMLEDIPQGTPAFDDELFGPVALMFKVASFDEAISLANETRFGLSSAVFTADKTEMERSFNEIEAGMTMINTTSSSDPRLPFGGVKASGHGRELSSAGLREFMNIKTCAIGATH
ncbi:MAG: NAD-dependent succinate-semialdehyde dehydrogenase [Pseudomonadota bacterium]